MLEQRIAAALSAVVPDNAQLVVAFSGGLDSTVLLHALQQLHDPARLRAVHVNHGLHDQAVDWPEHCRRLCEQWSIPFTCLTVTVDPASGDGPEAAARFARYSALAEELAANEYLVTAHHQQDQLETVLLALLRGSGVHGLAAMPGRLERQGMTLVRPLLEFDRSELEASAHAAGLQWLDDPSNLDEAFDRNYLRHQVVPLLEQRWPAAARSVSRSARLAADAMHMLDALAAADCGEGLRDNCLDLNCLRALEPARQRNLLRWACRRLKLSLPTEMQLGDALQSLLSERADAEPLAAWPGTRIRRYREALWFYAEGADPGACRDETDELHWDPRTTLRLGPVRGTLSLADGSGSGVANTHLDGEWRVRFRAGGEQLRPGPRAHRRDLKKLLQEAGVLPWMRKHIPLVYLDEQLLAAGDLWLNADHPAVVGQGGKTLQWREHLPLQTPG